MTEVDLVAGVGVLPPALAASARRRSARVSGSDRRQLPAGHTVDATKTAAEVVAWRERGQGKYT